MDCWIRFCLSFTTFWLLKVNLVIATIMVMALEKILRKLCDGMLCAANQGSAYSQVSLGYCYSVGIGVEQNYEEAFRCYGLAANQGYTVAQYNIGVI